MPEEKISKSKKIDKAISFKSSYFVLRAFFSALPLLYAMVFYEANAEQLPVKNYTIADGLARDYVNRIRQDSHGFMWFCTSEGISRFDGYGFTNYGLSDGLPHRMINDFLETRDGLQLFATNRGLVQFNPTSTNSNGSHFTVIPLDQIENSKIINRLIEDEAGIIWCGTVNGLYRLASTADGWQASLIEACA